MIYIDMDGVLCDFVGGVAKLIGQDPNKVKKEWPVGETELAVALKIKPSLMWTEIKNSGPDFWSNLDPHPDGFELLKKFDTKGVPWCVASRPSLSPDSVSGKLKWLQKYFGTDFKNYFFCHRKQMLSCGPYQDNFLIDDFSRNIVKWSHASGRNLCYLVPRPWNDADPKGGLHLVRFGHTIHHHWNSQGLV